jgi:hypothetical protein
MGLRHKRKFGEITNGLVVSIGRHLGLDLGLV